MNLPKGEASELDPESTRTISVDIRGDLFLDDIPITEEALKNELMELVRALPNITVLVRADEALPYRRVVEVMRILHQAKIVRMALVTQPEQGGAP